MGLSKVKSVQASGSFENAYGEPQGNPDLPNHGKKLLYKFEYAMEDGTIITANHKTNTSPFPSGTEVEYEVKKDDPQYGKSGSVKKPDTGNYQNNAPGTPKGGVGEDLRQLMIVRQSSLKVATEILTHNALVLEKPTDGITKLDPVDVVELAGRFTKWVMQPDKPKPQPEKVQDLAQSATEALMDEQHEIPASYPNQ